MNHCPPRPVNVSLAAWPGLRFEEAVAEAIDRPPHEPLLGTLVSDHIQLCPQNRGVLTPELAQDLRDRFPRTRFRLHANVRVLAARRLADLADWSQDDTYWQALAARSQSLDALTYTAHAGRRDRCTLPGLLDNARQAAALFNCPVGIEGHYPTRDNPYLISDWNEYRALFDSRVPYALDLSHLNIVATRTRSREQTMVREMLACERCLEVHLSGNNGTGDEHRVLEQEPWWWSLLDAVHDRAVIFSEGNLRRYLRETACRCDA
ncbi:hypothetical protein [Burkholderia multivorans]|uniref:hypothetical protein n=1 Tax=Burkholderia multivorans TaxID=87883 RepID=UPI0021BF4EF5|nr:hypothetical protein [Burkholderia multivorans]MDR8763317.1 hypothetical protein [Burkholderia multivorans]MDR8768998.1 hypothetical protein [Burkholderia multivorans]MDR8774912.1 hypothetical protein [Burkholderia multivorans]MDR8792524.1 hypothetical protein [Burkholderia multivorans]MDR8798617.1 hypothetical protein [Burkholderia multivorans]